MTIQWNAWNPDTDIGDGPIVAYNVYVTESQITPPTSIPANKGLIVSTFVTSLSPDTSYQFCIKVERMGGGGEGPCSYVTFTTLSIVPEVPTSTKEIETITTGGIVEITTMETPPSGSISHVKIIPPRKKNQINFILGFNKMIFNLLTF